jgi:hypothetical protein
MTTTNAQNVDFQAPPSEHNVKNVLASQPRTLYLNNPRGHKEEDEPLDNQNPPSDTSGTVQNNSSTPQPNWEKRYSDLRSYTDKELNTLKSELADKSKLLADTIKKLEEVKEEPIKVPNTPEEVAEFMKKWPQLGNIMITLARQESFSTKEELKKALKKTEDQTRQLAAEKARAELLEIHPDALTIKQSPEFIEWFNAQVQSIKNLITSDYVQDVARGLDIYKKDTGIIAKSKKQKEEEQRQLAHEIPTNTRMEIGGERRVWRASEVNKMHPREFAKHQVEIEKAWKEGRYDENS